MVNVQENDSSETRRVSKTTVSIMGMEFVINQSTETYSMEQSDEGYGWSIVSIDNIKVTGDSIAYGVSTDAAFPVSGFCVHDLDSPHNSVDHFRRIPPDHRHLPFDRAFAQEF